MAHLWVTTKPVTFFTVDQKMHALDEGTVLTECGFDIQQHEDPDWISFTWDTTHGSIHSADVIELGCGWFALCAETAIALRRHPVLGFVPVCEAHTEENFS